MWKGNFDKAVDILKPLRYDVVTIGGSNAQVCEFYWKFTHMSATFCEISSCFFRFTYSGTSSAYS